MLLMPQWLADVMKELMQIKRSDSKYNQQSLYRLKEEGIADENILSILWEKKIESFHLIIIFLQAYGLIVPVGQEPRQYYIPSQLPIKPPSNKRMSSRTDDCNLVYISFDGFLPPFILHHLMFKMYSDSRNSRDCCFIATKGFIEQVDDCQWWVCQGRSDVIEVWIR